MQCPKVVPVNSPKLLQPFCRADADLYGAFGGQPYPAQDPSLFSNTSPITSLRTLLGPYGVLDPCPDAPGTPRVQLGYGVSVPRYGKGGKYGYCQLIWQQDGWDIDVGPSVELPFELPNLEQVVALVHKTHLPAAHGVVSIEGRGRRRAHRDLLGTGQGPVLGERVPLHRPGVRDARLGGNGSANGVGTYCF